MKNLDRLDFTNIYGKLGQLQGYLNGLESRIAKTSLKVESPDIKILQKMALDIENRLDKALGYGVVCPMCKKERDHEADIEMILKIGMCTGCDHLENARHE